MLINETAAPVSIVSLHGLPLIAPGICIAGVTGPVDAICADVLCVLNLIVGTFVRGLNAFNVPIWCEVRLMLCVLGA